MYELWKSWGKCANSSYLIRIQIKVMEQFQTGTSGWENVANFLQRMMTELKYTSRPRRWDITRNHREKVFSSPRWGCPPLNFSHSLKIPLISINFICDWKHWPYPPPSYLLKLFSDPLPFLHASLGCSFTSYHPSVHLPWQLSSVASILKKNTHIESLPSFSPICVVMWCPAITFPTPSHLLHLARCYFSVSLFNSSVLSHEMTTLPPSPRPSYHPIRAHGLSVSPPPFNPLLAWMSSCCFLLTKTNPGHMITHWFKSGPGLSNQIAEDF